MKSEINYYKLFSAGKQTEWWPSKNTIYADFKLKNKLKKSKQANSKLCGENSCEYNQVCLKCYSAELDESWWFIGLIQY